MSWEGVEDYDVGQGAKAYLDRIYGASCLETEKVTVLASTILFDEVYYAAIESIDQTTGKRQVYAAICPFHYNPLEADGITFSFNELTEDYDPLECDCPQYILDLLTPTESEYAANWRQRCAARLRAPLDPRLREKVADRAPNRQDPTELRTRH